MIVYSENMYVHTYIHTYVYPSTCLFSISSFLQSSVLALSRSLINLPSYSPLPSSLCISNHFFLQWQGVLNEVLPTGRLFPHCCLPKSPQGIAMWQHSCLTPTYQVIHPQPRPMWLAWPSANPWGLKESSKKMYLRNQRELLLQYWYVIRSSGQETSNKFIQHAHTYALRGQRNDCTAAPWRGHGRNFICHLSSACPLLQSDQWMCAFSGMCHLRIRIAVLPKDLGVFRFPCVCYSIKRKESEEWLSNRPSTHIHSAGFFFF